MSAPRREFASFYLYDPLDRLLSAHSIQRFYNSTRIATVIHGDKKNCYFESEMLPLAVLQPGSPVNLLTSDLRKTVLLSVNAALFRHQVYCPFGHRHPAQNGVPSLPGFNGERADDVTGHYLLGQGYRSYNPVLMRFNSPDRLSPFGKGGVNAYAYCGNDPVNHTDPTGKIKRFFIGFGLYKKPDALAAVRRATKSPGSILETEITPAPTPKKKAKKNLGSTRKASTSANKKNIIGGENSRKRSSAVSKKTKDAGQSSQAQNGISLDPIHNFAAPDERNAQLLAGMQPATSGSSLHPIFNYALPGEWQVRLVRDPMQPVVRLIRTQT